MNFNTVLKTAALVTMLAFTNAGHAEVKDAYQHEYNGGGMAVLGDGDKALSGVGVQGVAVYDMTNLVNAAQTMLAFCIAPTVALEGDANYFASYNVSLTGRFGDERGNLIKALFETSYRSLATDDNKVAFQLALWDLEVDDGKLDDGEQLFHRTEEEGTAVNQAYDMLSSARLYLTTGGSLNTFSYTAFNTADGALASQELLGASIAAVPEADTWAMLMAGLGLVGFVGRRRAKQQRTPAA